MPSALVTIIRAQFDDVTYDEPTIIEDHDQCPPEFVQYGYTFEYLVVGYEHLGITRKIVDNNQGDVFQVRIFGSTDAEIKNLVKALIKIADNWTGTLSDEYRRFQLLQNNTVYDRNTNFQNMLVIGLLATRSGEVIYT